MKLSDMHFNVTNLGGFFKKNLSLLLLIFLIIIFISVGFVVFKEVRNISRATADLSGITGQTVRVNLGLHQELSNHLDENQRFVPKNILGNSIFSPIPKPSK